MPRRGIRYLQFATFVMLLSFSSVACLQDLLNQFKPSETKNPSPTFKVTAASAGVDSASFSGACPRRFTFTGTITASQAGTVTYKWERHDGSATATQTMTFAAGGSQTASGQWELATSGAGWQRLHVLTPNDLTSNQAAITLFCQ